MELSFDSICTFPLPSDVSTLATHATSPVVALGLASGHVQLQRLPALPSSPSPKAKSSTPSTNGHGTIETAWRTRRHKGSCRSLVFSTDYGSLFSAGSDGIVKAATTETGQVSAKIVTPSGTDGELDPPTLLHALSPQTLLLATDSSALHIYDLRSNNTFIDSKPQQTHHPHYEYISSISPLTPSETSTSGYSRQWFSTGGSTVAVTDIRKGVVFESGDFEEEMLSSTAIRKTGSDRIIAGGEKGALRMWEDGAQGIINGIEKRLSVQKGESLDVICRVPENVTGGDVIAVGLGDGTVSFARTGSKRPAVLAEKIRHDEVEGVMALGFDPDGRLISGGGSVVKVWEKKSEIPSTNDEDLEEEEGKTNGMLSHGSDESEDDESTDSSSEEEKPKRKKRKRNKGKDKGKSNHIPAFIGMD